MPTLEDNKHFWGNEYGWPSLGEEWSADWGGSFMQWYGTILPRIAAYVPTGTILEIACGCGRWTQYLKNVCRHLIAVDLSPRCIEVCKRRFGDEARIEFHVNDGTSLRMVPEASVDLVFSFDSLVHADASVLTAYLSELPRILKRTGVAFIHHSNLGEYARLYASINKIPWLEKWLQMFKVLEQDLHGRDFSVDARRVETWAAKYGLTCISQEIIGTTKLWLDCLSTLVQQDSPLARPNRVLRNKAFVQEKANLKALSWLYGPNN
ncbi:MAG: class I SAM-dependent methyltransferase [Methylohalobius sp.]|nr:class I SAM-dependent methyltransferase [Methylohalobius sp.]